MSTQRRDLRGPRPAMMMGEKPKNLKASWGKLLHYSKRYVMPFAVAFVMAIIGTVFLILGPDRLGAMTNEILVGLPAMVNGTPVIGTIDLYAVRNIGLLLVGFYVAALILNFFQGFIIATVTQRLAERMRGDISKKINKIPLKYFDKTSHGDILSRVTNDVDTIGQALNQSIGGLGGTITSFLGSAIMMFLNSWILALVAIFASALGFVGMGFFMSRSQKYFVQQQKDIGEVNGHIEEIYSAHNVVKVYNGGKEAKRVFEEINGNLFVSGWKSQFISGLMMPFMMFIGNFGYVAVCVAGAALVLNGNIEFGVIVAFMIYIRMFTQPLQQIAQAAQNLQRVAAASERVFELLGEDELADESQKTHIFQNIKGNMAFKNVNFGYSSEKTIINDFSANIKAGQKVAIVGPTGAGKTTIVNLIMRFYELNGGEITIDGIPTTQARRENIHEQFCMVLQDTWLFEGSIKENIIYCKENITDEQVISACKSVGLHHFINTLPQKYDTILNDKVNISQGQRQLVTIVRAMIQNAPMLILDEATSSVDTRTEHLIQEAMDKLMVGRTSFVIAHRLSTIKNADLILVMQAGDIVESGTHFELLEKNGFYAELYNSQFEVSG
ncbi:MAG: ABC transporter ATP-binding protein/permease [Turicibacter sp.]|nr:ABC transporter ATP-binding protein/permease [Turicibacter sp.]